MAGEVVASPAVGSILLIFNGFVEHFVLGWVVPKVVVIVCACGWPGKCPWAIHVISAIDKVVSNLSKRQCYFTERVNLD